MSHSHRVHTAQTETEWNERKWNRRLFSWRSKWVPRNWYGMNSAGGWTKMKATHLIVRPWYWCSRLISPIEEGSFHQSNAALFWKWRTLVNQLVISSLTRLFYVRCGWPQEARKKISGAFEKVRKSIGTSWRLSTTRTWVFNKFD